MISYLTNTGLSDCSGSCQGTEIFNTLHHPRLCEIKLNKKLSC